MKAHITLELLLVFLVLHVYDASYLCGMDCYHAFGGHFPFLVNTRMVV